MKKMSAEQVQSALVFFWNLGKRVVRRLCHHVFDGTAEGNEDAIATESLLQKSGDMVW